MGKIIHENIHTIINHFRKDANHNSLKCGWCIALAEGEHPVCKGTPGIGEGSFILVFRSNMDLIVPAKPIQEGEKILPRKGIKYLIDERKGKVIFLCCLVQFSIFHTDSPFTILLGYYHEWRHPLIV